jgi:predicted SAM-dependent methyltransferase
VNALGGSISTGSTTGDNAGAAAPLRLQIGCSYVADCAKEGWTVVDAEATPYVHIAAPSASDLRVFGDASVAEIFSSHTLEHFSYEQGAVAGSNVPEVEACLAEWNRVLRPGTGKLRLTVPDLQVLSELFSSPTATYEDKVTLLSILYGGQTNVFDFRKTGFFFDALRKLLRKHNFCDVTRVEGEFVSEPLYEHDASQFYFTMGSGEGGGVPAISRSISINLEAWRCM